MRNMADSEEESPSLTLPKTTAKKIIGGMILTAVAGISIPDDLKPLAQALKAENPWRRNWTGKSGMILLSLATLGICLKQFKYYYRSGTATKDGVFQTIKAYSNLEYHLDWALGIWGAALFPLFPVASFYTPAWLLAFSIYCFLGILRCRYTLQRPSIAATAAPPIRSHLFSKYLGRALPATPSDEEIRTNMAKVSASLEALHGIGRTPVKRILAGWVWSFRIHLVVAFVGFSISTVLLMIGKTSASIYFTLICASLVLILFLSLSTPSLEWGTRNADFLMYKLNQRARVHKQ
jgi:hypothetical protein